MVAQDRQGGADLAGEHQVIRIIGHDFSSTQPGSTSPKPLDIEVWAAVRCVNIMVNGMRACLFTDDARELAAALNVSADNAEKKR